MVEHSIEPLFDEKSKVLILGSFPSVKSREEGFFYGHHQNRFWKVLATVLNESVPQTVDQKRAMLLKHKIALWDVVASCEIEGSKDSSITDVVPNDLSEILEKSQVSKIFVNGGTAKKLYDRYTYPQTQIEAIVLPSTSPANAAWSLERLTEKWAIIKK